MTFCKFYSIFCKVNPKVTLKVTLDSARQITIFVTSFVTSLSPIHFETISTPNLHFWCRNATNKLVFWDNFAILKVWRHFCNHHNIYTTPYMTNTETVYEISALFNAQLGEILELYQTKC